MIADKKRLYADVEFLTTIRPYRNYKNIDTLRRVAEYIRIEFGMTGLDIRIQQWKAKDNIYENVIASYQPEKKKRVVIGAHYDVYREQPGADDNASGVAGMLETARLIARYRPELDYRIDFAAYCLEEPPFFATKKMGSYIHAESLHAENADVMGMLSYEMIGYFSDEPGMRRLPPGKAPRTEPDFRNFIGVVGIEEQADFHNRIFELMKQPGGISVQKVTFADASGFGRLSDQKNFWKFGYPGLMIHDSSSGPNPHYHKKSDTIDTLNFDKMAEVVNSCTYAVTNL